MKKITLLSLFAALAGIANAATVQVTLQFSSTTVYLSNFANASGTSIASDGSNRMVWGLLVDVSGDGFDGASALNPYRAGFSLAANANGLVTTTTTDGTNTVASDDILVVASAVMANNTVANDSSSINMNRVLSFTSLNLTDAMQGKSFAVVWFDALATGGTTTVGQKYGVYNTGLLTPTAPGTFNLSSNFAGADSLKTMDYALGTPVPETSTSLLGAIGALALLRRRRN